MANLRRVAPPPSDEQLAAAELTDRRRRANREAEIEDQQEQERLAQAGDPEAQARVALMATASVLDSRPIGEEAGDVETTATPVRKKRQPRVPKTDTARTPEAPPVPKEEPDEEGRAWRLMDLAYKKWAVTAKKDRGKADRELALDLGKDAVLYYKHGIIRMADLHSTIEKLTSNHKANKDEPDDEAKFLEDVSDLQRQLRGEK